MLFAIIEDTVWNAIIAGVVTIVLAYIQMLAKIAADKAAAAAGKAAAAANDAAKDVKQTLALSDERADKQLKVVAGKADEQAKVTAAKLDEVTNRVEDSVAQAASKAEEVRKNLETINAAHTVQLDAIARTGEETHALVNSAMGEQKRLLAITARAKSDITNDPIDIAAATAAEEAYNKHIARQEQLDRDKR